MKNQLSSIVDGITHIILLCVAGFIPLLFLNSTTEFYDMPKLIFLIAATVALLGLSIFSWILKGKITITKTPLDIPLILFLAVIVISTFFSGTRLQAIYGDFPSVHGSAVSWICYILLYFAAVANLKTATRVRNFLYVFCASAAVVAVLTIASFFGIFLPVDFAKTVNFTPTGSGFSTVALLMLLLPLPLISVLHPNKYLPTPMAMVLSILFGVTIALTGSVATYVILALVFAFCFIASKNHLHKDGFTLFLATVIVVLLTLTLVNVPFPGNKIQQMSAAYPKEIQLPLPIAWKVSVSSFRDAPFFGTGPASYLFNFTSYKPVEFNVLKYWNFSFQNATNEFLQVLGTLGIFGFVALLLLCVIIIKNSAKYLSITGNDEGGHNHQHILLPALAITGLISVALFLVHANTLVSTVVTLLLLAAFMMSEDSIRNKETHISMGLKAATSQGSQFDLLPVVIFIVFLIGAGFLLNKTYSAVSADVYHRESLLQANKNGTLTYKNLQKAETLNPLIDLYRVDMAQTNFALANAIAVQKGPTKDNPKGSLTTDDRKTIQTLLSQAINEGRASVALSPRSSRNWEVLASIYRNITGVASNALTFSLDAYGKAIQRDPLNPSLRFTVGSLYYSLKNYDSAIRFYTDTINLKPDYINAYYNLAIAYRDKGDVQSAKIVADQTLTLIKKDQNPKDYQTVSKLDSELNDKIKSLAEAQAKQANTGLKNQNLPSVNVAGLNNPPTVATPSAIKANPNVKIPQVTVSPSASPSPTVTQ